jgi:hypothetical protein
MKQYVYATSCINSTAELIGSLQESAVEVTYRTFQKHCRSLGWWAKGMSYFERSDQGLTLKNDWHVQYCKGIYDGMRCYFLVHSRIEHIWVHQDDLQ